MCENDWKKIFASFKIFGEWKLHFSSRLQVDQDRRRLFDPCRRPCGWRCCTCAQCRGCPRPRRGTWSRAPCSGSGLGGWTSGRSPTEARQPAPIGPYACYNLIMYLENILEFQTKVHITVNIIGGRIILVRGCKSNPFNIDPAAWLQMCTLNSRKSSAYSKIRTFSIHKWLLFLLSYELWLYDSMKEMHSYCCQQNMATGDQ